MIIESATFKNLNGYLNPTLSFSPNVNIIIGVNGSGKTSVLNAIAWTLSPSSIQGGFPTAYWLANLMFDEIQIEYSLVDGGRKHRVTAKRTDRNISIGVDSIAGEFEIPLSDSSTSSTLAWFTSDRTEEQLGEFYRRHMEDRQHDPVVRHLANLLGPLYLPLDRRWNENPAAQHRQREVRAIFAGHVPIAAVLDRVTRGRQFEVREENILNETLRNDLLTALFDASEFDGGDRVLTMDEVNVLRLRVGALLDNLQLAEARRRSEELFAELEESANKFGGQSFPDDFLNDSDLTFWLKWAFKVSPIGTRLLSLMPIIEKYEANIEFITKRSTNFLRSVNSFISDTGKLLRFSDDGELIVKLPDGHTINSQNLASGELQLLVLFAFLCFGFDSSNQRFPVLVDEPELSLHVAWQNRYVQSIAEANQNAQFILATHSPEIAGPVEDHIIDISPIRASSHVEL